MRKILKLLVMPAASFAALIFLSSPVHADSKFAATYNLTYEIQTSGTTLISQNIDLKNLTASFYATEYSLNIGATHIKNVSATDSGGSAIPTTVTTDNDNTKIHLTFNQKVVGLGRVMSFKLTYQSDDIAVRNGFVWEVTIPKLATSDGIDAYNLALKTPREIGVVASISPEPIRTVSDGDFNLLYFNKDQLTKSGVNASFGDHQVFNFTLKYHLENSKFFPVFETVALPPDTENQTIVYTKLTPAPVDVTVDTDGNYLAKYRLDGNQKVEVILTGQVKIWNKSTNPPRSDWSNTDLSKFTGADKYWETTFPAISDKAKELKTPEAIYNYVTTTLKYDYNRASGKLERYGAATAIQQPEAKGDKAGPVCMEFTDLFIALARAAGIPARELDGFAYTTNSKLKPRSFAGSGAETKSDILHAWAEYWNVAEKRWVQIDPTWGSTTGGVDYFNKLDMNHFVFVLKGVSSTEPFPAGSYKTDPSSQNGDVDVSIAPSENEITASPSLELNFGQIVPAGLPFGGQIALTNSGNSTIFSSKINLTSSHVSFPEQDLGPIPPLSQKSFDFSGRASDFNLNSDESVVAMLTGADAKAQPVNLRVSGVARIRPLYIVAIPWVAGLVLVAVAIYFARRKLSAWWPPLLGFVASRFPWLLKR